MRWIELLWRIEARPEAVAWFDWASGIVRVEVSKNEFDDALERMGSNPHASVADSDVRLVRTVTHEHVHLLQAVTTGYLYRWCTDYAAILREIGKQLIDGPDDDRAMPDVLRDAPTAISSATLARCGGHLAKLDDPGVYGLSTRSIFEAHALLLELMVHHVPIDHTNVLAAVSLAEPTIGDRYAFDLVRLWLGTAGALEAFPALAIAALCTDDPPRYFVELLRSADWDALLRTGALSIDDFVEVANALVGPHLIGTAAEEFERSPESWHPTLTSTLETIRGDFEFAELLGDPMSALDAVAAEIIQPTLFRSDDIGQFTVVVPKGKTDASAENALLLAALSASLQPALPATRATDSWGPLHWLAGRDGRLRVLNVQSPFIATAEALCGAFNARAESVALWGSCVLAFELPHEVLAPCDAGVREFVTHLNSILPSFPLFLDFTGSLGMFWVWFGALAPELTWDGAGFDVAAPPVRLAVASAVSAMVTSAGAVGLDAQPQIDRMLEAVAERN